MTLFRFWRKSIPELAKDYVSLRAKTDTAREFYDSVPMKERENRLQAFRKWLELYTETNRYMIEVVNRFSPNIAKSLKSQIVDYSERAKELLKKEYWESSKFAVFTEKKLDEPTKELLDDSMKYADVHEKEVHMAFVVVFDTLRRVKGELPLEPDEQTIQALASRNPRVAKIYEGAYRALESDNPDRYRHCSVCMREVLDGL